VPSRRSILELATLLGAGAVVGEVRADRPPRKDTADTSSPDFDVKDLFVDRERCPAGRFTLLSPKPAANAKARPLVVALHGLGEAHDERLGAYAWLDLYGLRTAYARLLHPPIERTSRRKDLTDARMAALNAELARAPFEGLVVACPFTPNPKTQRDPQRALDAYADWIVDDVLPRARREGPAPVGAGATALVGCSMGGAVALEVFARRPEAFGALGLVQGAVSEYTAARIVPKIEKAVASTGSLDLHLLTSEGDPFLAGHRALAAALAAKGIVHTLDVLPGPHDQPWLREIGAIEMLLHQDRRRP
jgi:pimeloyl-ACP methyl ester carboxylesterase